VFCTVSGEVWVGNREGVSVRESVTGGMQVGDSEGIVYGVFVEDITGGCR
jgi:hypothetical protein